MKKKKNGFIFVETIITISVLTISLLIIYRAFSSAIDTEKQRLSQDQPVYLYRTYYILEFLQNGGLDNYIAYLNEYNQDGKIAYYQKISCESRIHDSKKMFCKALFSASELGIENVYILNYNIKDVLKKENKKYQNEFNNTAIDYIRTFPDLTENEYMIMVEYKENCHYLKKSDSLDEAVQTQDSTKLVCDYNYASIKVSGDIFNGKVDET